MTTLTGAAPRGAMFLRIAWPSAEATRLWLGFGDIGVPANALDVGAETYSGMGAMVGVPQLQNLLNGVAERVGFTLSGVPAAIAELAESEADEIDGALVNVGIAQMDDDWQIDGDVLWLWTGLADVLKITLTGGDDGSQAYTLELSVGAGATGRARPDFANWSDAQHQRAHPGDLFFNHVPANEATKRWPGG